MSVCRYSPLCFLVVVVMVVMMVVFAVFFVMVFFVLFVVVVVEVVCVVVFDASVCANGAARCEGDKGYEHHCDV